MDEKFIKDIELDKVLSIISSKCLSKEGKENINFRLISFDKSVIEDRYRKIDTIASLLLEPYSLDLFPPLEPILNKIERNKSDLDGKEIYDVGLFLSSYIKLLIFLKKEDEIKKEDKELSDDILSSLDFEGNVYENHPRLLPLIKAREKNKERRSSFATSYINENKEKVRNQEPVYKDGRVEIALNATVSKNNLVVLSTSSSGSTIFCEPEELVKLNNAVILEEEKIRVEKIRIKHELSEKVKQHKKILEKQLNEIIEFDFYYSFSHWVLKEHAKHPNFGDSLKLIEARHPLLGKRAIPINIDIPKDTHVLVLSGANAGGKTVTMKTIALSSLLFQISGFALISGLSTLPIYTNYLSDIGDGQSIEESTSTFSSHMKNISRITRLTDEKTMVLLDELGSGTDPEEGALLSTSILDYLSKHSSLTIATSHYTRVKNLAYIREDMMNAGMEFDEKNDSPTYKVLSGLPSDSHAFASAKRAQLPKEILDNTKKELSKIGNSSASLINSLISKGKALDRKITELELEKKSLETKIKKLEEKQKELEKKEYELKNDGLKEINIFLRNSRKELVNLVRTLKEDGRDISKENNKVLSFISKLEESSKKLDENVKKEEAKFKEKEKTVFNKNDQVESINTKQTGIVLEKRGDEYLVLFDNGLRLNVKGTELTKVNKVNEKSNYAHFKSSVKKAKYVLDVRGKTSNEVIEILDNQIEASLLDGLTNFSIIHGYGDGILSKTVQDYLKARKEVESYHFAKPEDGGMGKTYVKLYF